MSSVPNPDPAFPSRLFELSGIKKEFKITEEPSRVLSDIIEVGHLISETNQWSLSSLINSQGLSLQDHISERGRHQANIGFKLEPKRELHNNEMLISCSQVSPRSIPQLRDKTGEVNFAPNSLGGTQTNAIVTAKKSSDKLVQNNNKINIKQKHSNVMAKEFLCIVCNGIYKTAWKLNKHMKSHTAYESVACGICNKVVAGPDKLKTHTQFCHPPPSSSEYHGDEGKIEEEKAKDQNEAGVSDYSRAKQGSDKEEDDGNKFFCSVCNLDCGSSELLEVHESGDSFFCRVCAVSFDIHEELKRHFFSHKTTSCSVCRMAFYTKHDLLQHKNTGMKCKRKRREMCKLCNNRYVHKKSLEIHLKEKHPNAKPDEFFCLICNTTKNYRTIAILNGHLRANHDAYENVVCEICNKILGGPEKLKVHIKNTHLQSSVSCKICKKVLACQSSLELHTERKHGEKIACDICGKLVNGKLGLKDHLRGHNSFSCKICNLTFENINKRRVHDRNVHKMYCPKPKPAVCELCGKVYKSRRVLKKHMAIHSSEKPYVCQVCGAAFKVKVSLRLHSRIHSDTPKYKCKTCGEGFRWKQTFDKHVLNCVPSADEEMATEETNLMK